jgi:hypothetical protein
MLKCSGFHTDKNAAYSFFESQAGPAFGVLSDNLWIPARQAFNFFFPNLF